jgi:hypothetical protein
MATQSKATASKTKTKAKASDSAAKVSKATHSKEETHSSHGSQTTTDRDEIIAWAEERGAKPACVRGTGDKGDIGILRLDFPGYTGEDKLQEITWDEWFEKFEDRKLALLHQDTTASGEKSNFNKIISREHAKSA